MKSISELMKFLQHSSRSRKPSRRSGRFADRAASTVEAVEQRLLLSAQTKAEVHQQFPQDADSEPVSSFFVTFDSAQNTSSLRDAVGAVSVSASVFVPNGYTVDLPQAIPEDDAHATFSSLDGFQSLWANELRQQSLRARPNDPLYGDQWHLLNTGQSNGLLGADANIETAWDFVTGRGVTIGIVDDGLEITHEDLIDNVNTAIDFDWNGNDNDPSPVTTGNFTDNHGTAVAGVAAGAGNNGLGVTGAAYNAELVGLRLIAGPVGDLEIAQALTHQNQIIDIYNNSWGPADNGRISNIGPQAQAALQDSVLTGRGGLGTIHVWAGGNGGDITNDNVNYDPYANSRHTIAVGALTNSGLRSNYSDTGAPLIVTAYSNGGSLGITTTDLTGAPGYNNGNYADDFGGTSSAAPLVSGVIALMLEANPNLTYRDVTDILVRTSERIDPNNADWTQNGAGLWVNHNYGFGGIDATAAVSAAYNHSSLGPEVARTTGRQIVNAAIPDNGGGSVVRTINVPRASAVGSLEYVEVVFDARHTYIGDLEVVLTSPSGTQSVLAQARLQDNQTAYNNWVFSSARHWGESSEGTWTISVTDRQAADTGTFDAFELRFYGTSVSPVVNQSGGTTVVNDSATTDTFDVVLNTAPTSDVTLSVFSRDTGEVVVDLPKLTFTPQNWNVPQTVTVTGVTDLERDGDQQTDVVVRVDVAQSAPEYGSSLDQVIRVTSVDDDGNLPSKLQFLAPGQFPVTASPRFEWTGGVNAVRFDLLVQDVFTGNVVQQQTDLLLPRYQFETPFINGIYEAMVRGVNSEGTPGQWSDPLIFAIGDPAVPVAPTLTSPTQGALVEDNLTPIRWKVTPGATEYELYFLAAGNVTRVMTSGAAVSATELEYVPTTPYAEGFNSVWIRAFNPFEEAGPWSTAVGFTVDAFKAPTRPVVTAPIVTVTTDPFPTFRWIGPGASRYELWVNEMPDADNGLARPQRVIHVKDLVHTQYTHFNPLDNATHRVWVRGLNQAGEASEWSAFEEFTVAVPLPELPKVNEVGETQDQTPAISWTTASGEAFHPDTTFTLWVNNLSTGEARVILEKNVAGTSFTPETALPQGRYAVWVQAVSAVGVKSAWSERMVMNIDQPAPAKTRLTGPVPAANESVIKTDQPTFNWDELPQAATYELWVNHRDSNTVRIVHETDVATNSFVPATGLPQGTYDAWVRGKNAAGEVGPWSDRFRFELDVPTPTVPVVTGPQPTTTGVVIDPTPIITWTQSLPASTYDLQVEKVLNGELVIDETGLQSEQYQVVDNLQETTYRTRVRAINSAGDISAWSAWSEFRVDVPNATTPILIGPVSTVTSNEVTFEWRHARDSVQYELLVVDLLTNETVIQKRLFQLNQDGTRGVATEQLQDGTYRFWVRAFNLQGTSSGWSRSIEFTVDGRRVASLDGRDSDSSPIVLTSLNRRPQPETPPAAPSVPVVEAEDAADSNVHAKAAVPRPSAVASPQSDAASENLIETVLAEFADPGTGADDVAML